MKKIDAIRERVAKLNTQTYGKALEDRAFLLKLAEYAVHTDSDNGPICGTRLNKPCTCGLNALLETEE